MTAYAVGDIQGCYDALRRGLDKVAFEPDKDTLWVAGDLVNRGPDSLQTLRYLKSLGKRCKAVLGNHDLYLLAIAAGGCAPGGGDTLDAILAAPDRDELLEWLRQRPLLHTSVKHGCIMVHAGLPPMWSEKTLVKRAEELQEVLRGDESAAFLKQLYSCQPVKWDKTLQPLERLCMIANYFTRMRFCNAAGRLDLRSKSHIGEKGYAPWFSHPHKRQHNWTVIFGHWAALRGCTGVVGYEALDTGCVWGEALTFMRIKDKVRFTVPADGS